MLRYAQRAEPPRPNRRRSWRKLSNHVTCKRKKEIFMRAVVLSGPNQFAPAEIEKPQIGPDEILLEMKAAAICGTDMRILTGKIISIIN